MHPSSHPLPRPGDVLPHAAPFLLVDEVLALEGRSITAARRVPLREPWTEAHFPGDPLVPGVLLIEGMAQSCGVLARTLGRPGEAGQGVLAAVRSAKFLRPVRPGARLVYQAELTLRAGPLCRFTATASVDGERVAEADICLRIAQEEARA